MDQHYFFCVFGDITSTKFDTKELQLVFREHIGMVICIVLSYSAFLYIFQEVSFVQILLHLCLRIRKLIKTKTSYSNLYKQ